MLHRPAVGSVEHPLRIGGGGTGIRSRILKLRNSFRMMSAALRTKVKGSKSYADALAVYLAFSLGKCTDYWSALCSWHNSRE